MLAKYLIDVILGILFVMGVYQIFYFWMIRPIIKHIGKAKLKNKEYTKELRKIEKIR